MNYWYKKAALVIAMTTIGCFAATSCGTISSATSKTKNLTQSSVNSIGKVGKKTKGLAQSSVSSISKAGKKTKGLAQSSVSSLSNIIPSSRIPIAKVNEESLQIIPTGQERALAYQKKLNAKKYAALAYQKKRKAKRNSAFGFLRPSNYKPAKLPTVNDDPSVTTSVLPPLLPN